MSYFDMERLTDSIEGMIETGWDFFSRPYTDEDCLKEFGEVTIDDETFQITNHMMQSVVALIAACREVQEIRETDASKASMEIRHINFKLQEAMKYAAMSDKRIADALDKEIDWFLDNAGEENLVYGPTELMGYCRDRLKDK
jgi:hypothetical protein